MTHLVRIFFGGSKQGKHIVRAFLCAVILLGFLSVSVQTIFAQGGPTGGAGPVPNGSVSPATGIDGGLYAGAVNAGGNPGGVPNPGGNRPLTPTQQAAIDAAAGYTPASDAVATEAMQETSLVQTGGTNDPVLLFLHAVFVTGLGWVVGQIGFMFDYSVNTFIIGFGTLYLNQNIGDNIDNLWTTVRDIFNLTFIFGLVYIGFKMILDSSDSSARKMLVSLIGAALLVNFSLFITKFVVDFSNIAAYQVYKAFAGSEPGVFSLTAAFTKLMGINEILGVSYIQSEGGYQYVIGLAIVLLVLGYVFLAGAIMIMIRFAALCIYMVFSPFMFLGWVFPALQSYSKDYWSGFLKQAFFAPAFMFMLYLSYRVASSFPSTQRSFTYVFGTTEDGSQGGFAGSTEFIDPTIPFFAMVIVFLVASIVVSKKMGAHGANFATSVSGKIVGGATAGLAARAGRTVVGGSASALANNKYFQRVAANSYVGKQLYRATSNVADRSFDARQVGGVGKKLGVGEGKKGGFETRAKEDAEIGKKILGSFDKYTKEEYLKSDPAVKKRKNEVIKLQKQLSGTRDQAVKDEIQSKLDKAQLALTEAEDAFGPQHEFKNHLAYIERAERWQKTQQALLGKMGTAVVTVGTGILTGGIGTAIAAGAAYGAVGAGITQYTNSDVEVMRKAYGKNGSKKKDADAQEASLKKLAKIMKDMEEKKPDA